ncbi:spermatogenesis associated 2-like [Polypterus senegalus]|uniref:spermatogenesis associated 2-like n=1 Tax=Polypterus senegalus TaxID=55291 RepID=UPI00196263FE|nr:spermatogenesis associated 2-like [Polypterus senegalus]
MNRGGIKDICEEYQKVLENRLAEGQAVHFCDDAALKDKTMLLLINDGEQLHSFFKNKTFDLICTSLKKAPCLESGLEQLKKAFEVFELACLNLYLCPWRQEFRVIKMFSGAYMHYIKPVLTENDILQIFQKMGYKEKDKHHLEINKMPSPDVLIKLACGLYIARAECCLLLEMTKKIKGCNILIEDLIEERLKMTSVENGIDRLLRKFSKLQVSKKQELHTPQSSSCADYEVDLYTDISEEGFLSNIEKNPTVTENIRNSLGGRVSTTVVKRDQYMNVYVGGISSCNTPGEQLDQNNQRGDLNSVPGTRSKEEKPGDYFSFQNRSNRTDEYSRDAQPGEFNQTSKLKRGHFLDDYKLCGCLTKETENLVRCTSCRVLHTFKCPVKSCGNDSFVCLSEDDVLSVKFRVQNFESSPERRLVELSENNPVGSSKQTKCAEDTKYNSYNTVYAVNEKNIPTTDASFYRQKQLYKCSCMQHDSPTMIYVCDSCEVLHWISCETIDICNKQNHDVHLIHDEWKIEKLMKMAVAELSISKWKKHFCIPNNSCVKFACESCQILHGSVCELIRSCRLQHHKLFNIKDVDTDLVRDEEGPWDSQALVWKKHHCLETTFSPQFACKTCRTVHTETCPSLFSCKLNHCVDPVKRCSEKMCNKELEILCLHCCSALCRYCYFKTQMQCTCGKPFNIDGTEV